MPISAQSIVRRVTDTLHDQTSIRWPVGELARYFNDARREVVLYRPDAMATNAALTCAQGAKQSLPANGAKLLDIIRNGTTNKAVRLTNRDILDAQQPGWYAIAPSTGVVHYTYDPRDPKTFYVYPPATNATSLDILYAAYPVDIAEPAAGDYTAITGNLDLPDIFANVVADYMLYRCYSKDSTYAGNGNRAQAYYAAFANALGIEIKATMALQPTPEQQQPGV